MPIIFAITTLFVFQLLGEVLVRTLSIPLPGPLAGMLLLFMALVLYKKIPPALEQSSTLLIQHLMLLFIPAVTGVMLYFDRLKQEWFPFVMAGIFGTIATILATAYCLSWLLKIKNKGQGQDHEIRDNND